MCGAGNEEADEVYVLLLVYALAGASGIDVSASNGVVRASVKATNETAELASEFGLDHYFPPSVAVSVGMPCRVTLMSARRRWFRAIALSATCVFRSAPPMPFVVLS